MSTVTASAMAEVYTQAEHRIYAEHMDAENEGLRRHIDNKANALAERVRSLEEAQSEVHTLPGIREAQDRIYDELREITQSVHALNAVGIQEKLDEIQTTQREHGETLLLHTAQLQRHEDDIEDINSRAIADLSNRVNELEKADGKKALKAITIAATAVITTLVGWILGSMGVFGG